MSSAQTTELLGPATAREVKGTDCFVTRNRFRVGKEVNGVRIAWFGPIFEARILPKIEKNVPAGTLNERKLLKRSVDAPIIDALGGRHKAPIFVAHLHDFLKSADKRRWYLCYVEVENQDGAAELLAVRGIWRGGGWVLFAFSVEGPLEWGRGHWVLSCETL